MCSCNVHLCTFYCQFLASAPSPREARHAEYEATSVRSEAIELLANNKEWLDDSASDHLMGRKRGRRSSVPGPGSGPERALRQERAAPSFHPPEAAKATAKHCGLIIRVLLKVARKNRKWDATNVIH